MSAVAFSLWLLASVSTVAVVQGACQSSVNFTSVADLVDNFNACMYPTATLNEGCVSGMCLALNDAECPWNSDGSIDVVALNDSLEYIAKCIDYSHPNLLVCEKNWNPRVIPNMGLAVSVGGYDLQCQLNTKGFLRFIPPTYVLPNGASYGPNDPIKVLIRNQVTISGVVDCTFTNMANGSQQSLQKLTPSYTCNYTTLAGIVLSPFSATVTSATKDCTLTVGQTFFVGTVNNRPVSKNGTSHSQTEGLDTDYAYVKDLFNDVAAQANGQMAVANYMATFVGLNLQDLKTLKC